MAGNAAMHGAAGPPAPVRTARRSPPVAGAIALPARRARRTPGGGASRRRALTESLVVVVRPAFALLMLVAVAGCSGEGHAQARPSRPLVIPTPSSSPTGTPRPARPGTVCGKITTITGARARVVVVRGRPTCAEAMRVFQKYNDPGTPAEGTAGLVVIDHWTCETRRTVTTCTGRLGAIRTQR